jgi:3-methyladenine DNA glycosylase/8-oxoguanine DNA glycosylase
MGLVETRSIPIEGPLDLRRTLAPLHGRFGDDGWWLTARTPTGPGSLRIRRTSDALIGEAWGEGGAWLLDRLGAIGGLDDDPATFATHNEIVAELHRSNPGYRYGRTDLVFDSLVVAICGQKVTGKEAGRAVRGLYETFGDRAPGPNDRLRLPPDPERMAGSPYWAFHELHLEKRRADVLRKVSAAHAEIAALAGVPPSEAGRTLEAFDGIGEWSVAKTLEVSHGDPDQVAVGDFHFKHMVVHHLTGNDRGTDGEMLELLEQFRPHRGRVVRLLGLLGHEPKFGPRMPARDITRR